MQNKSQKIELGEILRSGRQKKELTQQQVADFLHVSNKAVSAWESNLREPNIENFIKLVLVLNIQRELFPEVDWNAPDIQNIFHHSLPCSKIAKKILQIEKSLADIKSLLSD